jgi:glycine cleavage system regulatory protein
MPCVSFHYRPIITSCLAFVFTQKNQVLQNFNSNAVSQDHTAVSLFAIQKNPY